MDDDLPKEFDLVVIGTGFPDSCVAAAASRVGKTVLHIDPNDYYGGSWASFNLDAYNVLLGNSKEVSSDIKNAKYEWHIPLEEVATNTEVNETDSPEAEALEKIEQWSVEKLMKLSRKFNFDLCPKVLYSSGSLVQLLISSNICRYAEFRSVDHVCTMHNGQLFSVPCSRSDVFNTKDLNIVEKRLLMKFLTICMTYGEDKCEEDMVEFRGKSFGEYLRHQKVTEKINKCVMQAIAMANEETRFEDGMERIKKFLNSLGRYGNTPFIFPMYGSGEIPQCFCRLCAVFGGIYCLKRQITSISVDESGQSGATITIDGKHQIQAKNIVCSSSNLPQQMRSENPKCFLSRGLFLASSPLGSDNINAGGGGVNLLRLTAPNGKNEAFMLQLAHQSGTCPKGFYIFHFTTTARSDNPQSDLEAFTSQIFTAQPDAPKLLYSSYFSICGYELKGSLLSPVIHSTAAPFYELDYDHSIDNARSIFSRMYQDYEFLPRAPDPEEIVIEGEDPKALSEQLLPDDLKEQLRELEKFTEQMEIEDVLVTKDGGGACDEAMDS